MPLASRYSVRLISGRSSRQLQITLVLGQAVELAEDQVARQMAAGDFAAEGRLPFQIWFDDALDVPLI